MVNKETRTEPVHPESSEKKPAKKRFSFRRILLLVLVLVIVLVAAILSTMEDGNHFSALRRYLMYGNSAETQDLYTYASHQDNLYERLGEDLLVVNPNSIQVLHQNGTALYELQTSMTSPVISVGSELAAVCDAQGDTVYILDNTGLLWKHQSTDGLLCYCARVNASDYIAITEQKNGYKASVCVYDKQGTLLFRFDSHDNYLSDALVTEDGKHLLVLALGENGGAFASTLIVYDLTTAQRLGEYPLKDGLALDAAITDDTALLLCDKRLAMITLAGETKLNYAYGERYLHNYALDGKDFCALLLGRYQSGNICQLITFSLDGEQLATLELSEEVLDISAAGNRLAVLYSNTLVIYDRNLVEIARLEDTEHAGSARMDKDGTALLIAETSAHRFLP